MQGHRTEQSTHCAVCSKNDEMIAGTITQHGEATPILSLLRSTTWLTIPWRSSTLPKTTPWLKR